MSWPLFFSVVVVSTLVVGFILVLVARDRPAGRRWVVVSAVSVAALPVSIAVHNLVSGLVGGDEAVSFLVALLVAPAGIAVGMLGAAVAIGGADRDLAAGIALTGGGVALFVLYTTFSLVVTTIEGGNTPQQAAIERVVLPLAALAIASGAIVTVVGAATRGSRRTLGPTT